MRSTSDRKSLRYYTNWWLIAISCIALIGCAFPNEAIQFFFTRTSPSAIIQRTTIIPTPSNTPTKKPTATSSLTATRTQSSPIPSNASKTGITPTITPGPQQITSGQQIWELNTVDFPSYITALGRLYSPPTRRDPYPAYVFVRLNFSCTTGKSLIQLYSGLDMGLNFVHKQAGYPDISIEDLQGHKYLVTLLGTCWLAAPIPRTRAKDGYFILNFKDIPPFRFKTHSENNTSQTEICFISDRDGTKEVFISDLNQENITRLTTEFSRAAEPSWSHDHQKIAYVNHRSGDAEITIISRTGIKIATLQISTADEGGPVWSPDDTRIAFHTYRDGNWEIYSISPSGEKLLNLSRNEQADMYPYWSPDGQKIAFQSERDGNWEIYLMDINGSNIQRLTNNSNDDILPAWSPDNQLLLFWSNRSGMWRLMVMDVDGQSPKPLTTYENPGSIPGRAVWSSDGEKILLTLMRDGFLQLFTMSSNGTEITRLSQTMANFITPDW